MAVDSIGNLNATSAVESYARQSAQARTQGQDNAPQASQAPAQDKVEISQQAKQLAAADRADTVSTTANPQQTPIQPSSKAIAAYQQTEKSF